MDQQHEEIRLDTEPLDEFLKRTPAVIERQRAWTANLLAVLLVAGVLLSLPVYLFTLLWKPDSAELINVVFEKWFALISPLAGAAVGAYYATRANV